MDVTHEADRACFEHRVPSTCQSIGAEVQPDPTSLLSKKSGYQQALVNVMASISDNQIRLKVESSER